ncbi:hypothetical protein KCM76_25340, partial [Zooshikella marina]|uniref:RHS repeat-associated core domain-containing protein n=1 Tax=Zooshikella ganghwensis TaxID=202772 RepID=UPI001C16A663
YGYDAVGNILSIDDGLQASLNQKFEYDALDRLALESGYFGKKTYQFDEVGNRTQRVWTTKADASGNSQTKKQVLNYHDNSNRLNKLNNETVSLDAMGNTLSSRGANATYDARGRLSSMTVNGELRAKYTYNAIGERVVKERILGGQSYYGVYQYDLAGQLLAEANYSSTRKLLDRHYVWLGNMPVAMIEVHYQGNGKVANTQVSYIHADHLNTPRRATNTDGNIVWAWYSDAYGVGQVADNPDGDGQTVTLNLRFPGQYFDAESGLFYNYFRDYDPSTGRYIESDPIGLNGGLNTYAYVEGNPVRYIDSKGLALETPWDVFNVGVGVAEFSFDVATGNYWGAAVSGVGTAYDAFASAVPFLPAGASVAIKTCRYGDEVVELASKTATSTGKTGRGKNHLTPDPKAQGPHSTYRRDANDNVSHHAEWSPNSKNPTGFDQTKRVDTQYSKPHTHTNKSTNDKVPTPHVHDKSTPGGVRPAKPEELPR